MPLHFKTKSDFGQTVHLAGVGELMANGDGPGIPVERAAQTMSELQEKSDKGVLLTDTDAAGNAVPKPLTGKALADAARTFAKDFHGGDALEAVNLSDSDNDKARLDAGFAPDRPPAAEVAVQEYRDTFAGLEDVNDNPNAPAQIEGTPEAGVPAPAPSTPANG